MGLYLKQDNHRSELQEKIATELRRKMETATDFTDYAGPETKVPSSRPSRSKPSSSTWVFVILTLFVIILVIFACLILGGKNA